MLGWPGAVSGTYQDISPESTGEHVLPKPPLPQLLQPMATAAAGRQHSAPLPSLFLRPASVLLEGPVADFGADWGISPESSGGRVLPKGPPRPEEMQPAARAAMVAGSRPGSSSPSLFPGPIPVVLEGLGAISMPDRGVPPESSRGYVLPNPPLPPKQLQPAATMAAAGPLVNPAVQYRGLSGFQQSAGWGQAPVSYPKARRLWLPGTSVACPIL